MKILNSENNWIIPELKVSKSGANSERASIVEQFVLELNKSVGEKYLKDGKWKKVTAISPRAVAIKTSHLSQSDLYYFLSSCKSAKCGFRKCFFGSLKVH